MTQEELQAQEALALKMQEATQGFAKSTEVEAVKTEILEKQT